MWWDTQEAIRKTAKVNVYPFAAITKGQKGEELADLEAMAENAIGYSDDGKGVQSDDMMREAMRRAKALGKVISAHCEDESLLREGHSGGGGAAWGFFSTGRIINGDAFGRPRFSCGNKCTKV